MSNSKSIKTLTLNDLSMLAHDIIVGAIENNEYTVIEADLKDNVLELSVQDTLVRLYYNGFTKAFEQNVAFDDMTEIDSLRCFINIKKGTKAFDILVATLVEKKRELKIQQLKNARKEAFRLEHELELV